MIQTHSEIASMSNPSESSAPVRITDIKMPFGSMVVFMVKWAIAAIPAIIILAIVGAVVSAVFGGLIAGMGHSHGAT
jgi:uncharacterized membrane-anchored protein YitT (DUF2179 family)